MIAHFYPDIALSTTATGADACTRFYRLFRRRQTGLLLLKQLVQIIKSVQKHRGMSMAFLGGNLAFTNQITRQQQQLEHRLQLLWAVAYADDQLSLRDQENLRNAWLTISRNWQQDSVIDNYELHCHLIEQLLGMLAALGKNIEHRVSLLVDEHPAAQNNSGAHNGPAQARERDVLHFTTQQLPAVIEQIGRVRALATYAAAAGHCDTYHHGKLRYAIECARVNNAALHQHITHLEGVIGLEANVLSQIKSGEIKLAFLLATVEDGVLTDGCVAVDSNRLFTIASDLIDGYFKIVYDGLNLIERWHEQDMENWLQSR